MSVDPLLTLQAIQACVDASEGRVTEALEGLAGRKDAESILARLTILLDLNRDEEALAIVNELPLDAKWATKAVLACGRASDASSSKMLLEAIDRTFPQDGLLRLRCRLVAAEAAYHRAFQSMASGGTVVIEQISDDQRAWIDAAAHFLSPIVDRVCDFGGIEHAVEQHALELACSIAFLRSDYQSNSRIGPVLERVRPLSMTYVEGVLRRQFDATPEVLHRLRSEHYDSWDAKIASIRIEAYVLERPERAAISALAMIRAAPRVYQEEFAKVLFDLSATLPHETAADIDRLISDTLPSTSNIPLAVRIRQALQDKNPDAAEELLRAMPDMEDPITIQFKAQILLLRGQKHEARIAIDQACKSFGTPGLLELAADLAAEEADWPSVAKLLARISATIPADARIRKKRAHALVRSEQYLDAAKEFAELIRLEPEERQHQFNHAASLAKGGNLADSLAAFQSYCALAQFPLDGIMGQCEILISLDRAADAFALLVDHSARYWDNRHFVAGYMSCAYSANRDNDAHKAMMRLQELERGIEPGQRLLRAVSLDDLKEHFTHFHDSDDLLHEQLLRGQIPWLFADKLLNKVPYAAWAHRTQPLLWESDDQLGAARFTIYATNGFHVFEQSGETSLHELECPPPKTPIVVDMSALITLHEIDMLDRAANYFGKIVVPAHYRESSIEHLRWLVHHQPSRRSAALAIRAAIESGRIAVPELGRGVQPPGRATLSEINDESHAYRFVDLANALDESGVIGADQSIALRHVAHAVSGVDAGHAPLQLGQELLCDVSTLETLHQQGLLQICLESFDVHLSPDDRKEVFSTVQAFDAQSQLHEKAAHLLSVLRDDPRFVVVQVAVPAEFDDVSLFDDALAASTFSAAFAAIEKDLPLYADDRALQIYVCQRRPLQQPRTFSTASFLEALAKTDGVDMAPLGSSMLLLFNWRYRFIVPPSRILKYYADQFRNHLPGRFLRQVAHYAHQSLVDPGLFSGFESTIPPTSIAIRLYFLWMRTFVNVAASCWLDESYSNDQARSVTEWVLLEAIPGVPRMLSPHMQNVVAAQMQNSVLTYLALATVHSDNGDRIKNAMNAVREVLKLSDAQYLHFVAQIAHEP